MCFFNIDPPELPKLPAVPTENDEAVRRREALERERLLRAGGSAGTVKTDLAPSAVAGGQRKVLLGA